VGGERAVFEHVKPLLHLMGKNIAWMGRPGRGQHTKMCNQILIAGTMLGTVECLLYAQRAGLGMDAVIDVIGQGAAGSWTINNLGRRIARNNYDPGFMIRHFVKDMGIALNEAARMKLSLPGLALVHQLYVAAMAQGGENLGTQGLYQVLARMNQVLSESAERSEG
jgi:3-hydroxyisobutyrate dehydrogenase